MLLCDIISSHAHDIISSHAYDITSHHTHMISYHIMHMHPLRFEYGLIAHAFTSAIRVMLKEYLILIAQLESLFHKRQLTMMRVWYYGE